MATTVDEYINAQPEASHPALQKVRGAIRKALPKAEESISYQIPTYKLNGKAVIYFAGWKKHYSLYPASGRLLEAFQKDLTVCEVNKSTLRFKLADPVPEKLITRLAKFRASEVAGE